MAAAYSILNFDLYRLVKGFSRLVFNQTIGFWPEVRTTQMGLKENVYNEKAVRKNTAIVDYCRTSGAVISGAAAGVLGLTGFYGFGFFILFSVFLSVALSMKAGTEWSKYFTTKRNLWLDGILGGLFTYILVWTFLYGMVHVY